MNILNETFEPNQTAFFPSMNVVETKIEADEKMFLLLLRLVSDMRTEEVDRSRNIRFRCLIMHQIGRTVNTQIWGDKKQQQMRTPSYMERNIPSSNQSVLLPFPHTQTWIVVFENRLIFHLLGRIVMQTENEYLIMTVGKK